MSEAPYDIVPWSGELPGGDFDYIVIGSGMGGLTCAASLSAMGRRVLVLEQHYTPGGFTHSFRRGPRTWDVGVHLVGEVTEKDEFGRLLRFLTGDRLKWSSLGPVYDRYAFPDGFTFEYPDSPEAYRAALLDSFPAEQKAIDRWLTLVTESYAPLMQHLKSRALPRGIDRVAQALLARGAKRFLETRAQHLLDELSDDPRLKAVLSAQWFYWGTPPSRSSAAVNLLAARMFLWGGYYPVGGSPAIADGLLRPIYAAGGCLRVRADVEEILVHRGRAVGVRVRGRHGRPSTDVHAKRVISAAGAYATVTRLLPEACRSEPWIDQITRLEPNQAHVCLYLGYRGDIRRAGASAANLGIYDTWDVEARWDVEAGRVGRCPFLWCGFGSLKNPLHTSSDEALHTGEVMAFLRWDAVARWSGTRHRRRGADYDRFKEELKSVLLSQLLERMPDLEPFIEHVELSTPLTTEHFARPVAGAIYGLHTTVERMQTGALRARTPIQNLFFAGNEVALSGVAGAGLGGVLAAVAAEPLGSRVLLRAMQ
ncbi:Carotenoid cis-trans isomerase [Minicystis rosea]|nr:Carotenoid cis-trans isomerase [Minicystis rosea]